MTPSPLSPEQQLAAHLLAQGLSVTDAAARANVSRSTLTRWRRLPEFAARVQERTDEVIASAEGEVTSGRDEILRLTPESARVIREAFEASSYVVAGPDNVQTFPNHQVRLKAAELQLRVAALLVNKVEHTGELQLSRMTDEELDAEIAKLSVTD